LYLDQKPEIAILVIGWNDGLRGLPTTNLQENILEIIDMYEEAWVKVVLWGMDVPMNLWLTYRNDFKKVYKDVAEVRDKVAFFEFFLDWVAGKSQYNIEDMIHPNPVWYDIIVSNLYEFLEKNKIITK
jgi:acyl-CoA thioesterase-1